MRYPIVKLTVLNTLEKKGKKGILRSLTELFFKENSHPALQWVLSSPVLSEMLKAWNP